MKNFLDMSFNEFFNTIPWNKNFHRFEGLNNAESIYLWAAEESYHCLIDCFYSFSSYTSCYAKDRLTNIKMFSAKDFIQTFNLQENAQFVAKFQEFNFDQIFDIAVEDVFNIFQFMKNYKHTKVKHGDIILQHPNFEKDLSTHYKIVIGATINAFNSEGEFIAGGIQNFTKKDSVYLDEIFGILNLAEGYFLTIKS